MPQPKKYDARLKPYTMKCDSCLRVFFATKCDARYCGPTCRQRAKRKRDKIRAKRKGLKFE